MENDISLINTIGTPRKTMAKSSLLNSVMVTHGGVTTNVLDGHLRSLYPKHWNVYSVSRSEIESVQDHGSRRHILWLSGFDFD